MLTHKPSFQIVTHKYRTKIHNILITKNISYNIEKKVLSSNENLIFSDKDGNIVEQNTKENIFAFPQHDYTKKLISSQTKKKMTLTTTDLPILKVKNLKVWYPIKKGILKRVIDHVKAVNDIRKQREMKGFEE